MLRDGKKLISSIKRKKRDENELLQYHRDFMCHLYDKLQLKNIDDWKTVSRYKIIQNGGKNLVLFYSSDKKKLLESIYPNYPWNFEDTVLHSKFDFFQNSIVIQRMFLEKLYIQFGLKSLEEWLQVSRKRIILNGGLPLIVNIYNNDIQKLLISLYPNYPWSFENIKTCKSNEYFQSIENQQLFMNNLFLKLNLNSFDDWYKVLKKQFIQNEGRNLISIYSNNRSKLLSSIYPNYPWEFDYKLLYKSKAIMLNSLENQRKCIEELYYELGLKTLDDLLTQITRKKIINKAGYNFILYNHANNLNQLYSTLYPNFPWNLNINNSDNNLFKENVKINSNNYFKSVQNQRIFMDELYQKLQLKSLDDWLQVPRYKISQNGGRSLINYYYLNNMKNLLLSVYPNHNWQFEKLKEEENNYFQSIENQRSFMDNLYHKLQLNSLDDWLEISRKKYYQYGGKRILHLYNNNRKKLLSSIYPNFSWNFQKLKLNANFSNVEDQRKFMDNLFVEFRLNSLDDWVLISRRKIIKSGGRNLLYLHYSNDLKSLFLSVYPEHNWKFKEDFWFKKLGNLKEKEKNEYFQSIDNQRLITDYSFKKLKLKKLNDYPKYLKLILSNYYYNFNYSEIKDVLYYYSNNISRFLSTIYPYFPWESNNKEYIKQIEKQKKIMDSIYQKLNLKSLEDWKKVKRAQIIQYGGRKILEHYSFNMKQLLIELYPVYDWRFEENQSLEFKPYQKYHKSVKFNRERLKSIIQKYSIREKKDWYRLPLRLEDIRLYSSLKLIFPNEKWTKELFILRSKKWNQRLLFLNTQQLFPVYQIIENYHHPHLLRAYDERGSSQTGSFEFDIFIAQLNLALEYQGEHHYDDMPSGFNFLELYKQRDKNKEILAQQQSIKVVYIPYWWNNTLSSLRVTISNQYARQKTS